MTARREQRVGTSAPVHLRMLDDDADEAESEIVKVRQEIAAFRQEFNRQTNKILVAMLGLAFTILGGIASGWYVVHILGGSAKP